MPFDLNIYSVLAVLAISIANFRYMYAIYTNTSRPSLAAALVFVSSLGLVLFSSMELKAVSSVLYIIGANLILNGVILVMTILSKTSHKTFTNFEKLGLALVVGSGILWQVSDNAWWALVVPTIIDLTGMSMVLLKLRGDRGSEDVITWLLAGVAYVLSTVSLSEIRFVDIIFASTNMVFCVWIGLMSLVQRIRIKKECYNQG